MYCRPQTGDKLVRGGKVPIITLCALPQAPTRTFHSCMKQLAAPTAAANKLGMSQVLPQSFLQNLDDFTFEKKDRYGVKPDAMNTPIILGMAVRHHERAQRAECPDAYVDGS